MVSRARNMRDVITYWATTGVRDTYGKPTYDAPVQIMGRWEDMQQLILSKHGKEYVSKSRVLVIETLTKDGYLYLGTSEAVDPTTVANAWEIQALGRLNDLRSMSSLTTAYL